MQQSYKTLKNYKTYKKIITVCMSTCFYKYLIDCMNGRGRGNKTPGTFY